MPTTISWTEETWNPVTGCDKVSPGCDFCYALTLAKRLKAMETKRVQLGKLAPEDVKYQLDGDPATSGPGFGVATHEDALTEPLQRRKPTMWFIPSMGDLFHARVPDEFIARVFVIMALAERHTFQLPTKRPKRMRDLLTSLRWRELLQAADSWAVGIDLPMPAAEFLRVRKWIYGTGDWQQPVSPLRNVWLGTSVENQKYADLRVPLLIDTPAAVRFLSCEPLLGPVDLTGPVVDGHRPRLTYWLYGRPGWGPEETTPTGLIMQSPTTGPRIDWVIAGGESALSSARLMSLDWARRLRDDCAAAGVPFHFKQTGTEAARALGISGKGDKFDELPADLQIREYPTGATL